MHKDKYTVKHKGAVFKSRARGENSQKTTQTDNKPTENGGRTDGKRRPDGNDSGRSNVEENQFDRIEKLKDDESLIIFIEEETMLHSWTDDSYVG